MDASRTGRTPRERLTTVRRALAESSDPLRDPLGVRFVPASGEAQRAALSRAAEAARTGADPAGRVLYVHVPFCARVCSYCLLAARPIERRDVVDGYVEALVSELRGVGEIFEGLPISAMHIGGGTPSVLSSAQLTRVLCAARDAFSRTPGFVCGIEAHPGSTSRAKLDVMVAHGVRRVSFGVESFTPAVLAHVGRPEQTSERVERAARAAREAGIEHINVDLLAGLPGETVESFEASVEAALALPIDSMSVNRFLAEGSALGRFGGVGDPAEVGEMLLASDRLVRARRPPSFPREPLEAPSYGTQYVWEREQRRYFQEDMIGPATTIAVGHGGMGHVHGGAYTIAGVPLLDWIAAHREGRIPDVLAWTPPPLFEPAFFVADQARRGELDPSMFAEIFGRSLEQTFGASLTHLLEERLLETGPRWRTQRPAIELLAYLAETRAVPPEGAASTAAAVEVASIADLTDDEVEALDVSAGTSAEQAQALLDRFAGKPLVVLGAKQVAEDQYRAAGDELPPSLLWCRLAIRAIAAMRAAEAAAARAR